MEPLRKRLRTVKQKKLSSKQAMRLAIECAKKGLGKVEPNPPVGCVILDSGCHLLSAGWHRRYGGDHAEAHALKQIKNKAKLKGARVFVTLEPCHHKGKVPPCSKELVRYSIQSLTYGADDPFTAGRGLHFLRKKGIKIIHFEDFKEELKELIAPFSFAFLNKKPFVSLKSAVSLDGVTALHTGESRWITGEQARRHSHYLRAVHTAVLIGVNTLLRDNPRLDIRAPGFKSKKNKVIILDPEGKSFSFLPKSNVLKARPAGEVIVFCSNRLRAVGQKGALANKAMVGAKKKSARGGVSSTARGVEFQLKGLRKVCSLGVKVKCAPCREDRIGGGAGGGVSRGREYFSLSAVLKSLYKEEGVQSVLVEGGAFCHARFLQERLAQRLYLYMAPRILGRGLHWSGDFEINTLSQSLNLSPVKVMPLGEDFLLTGSFL